MKDISLKFFAVFCAGLLLGTQLVSAETNAVTEAQDMGALTQSAVNGYLQIQAQLHDAQIAIEASRREMAEEAQRNTDVLAARIQTLEATVAAQRVNEAALAQKNQQFMLTLGAAFGLIVLGAVLFMIYLQWRALARVVEACTALPRELAQKNTATALSLKASATVEQSNAQLFGTVDALQKRILELEQSSRATLVKAAITNGSHQTSDANKELATEINGTERIAKLLTEGQVLLEAQEPAKALECFNLALELDSQHAEALVKKGGALEKLGKTDEAIACYDRAIEADSALTIAHLHKGGLFNRLARFDEALQCYEQALRTQEKKMPGDKVTT
jgi:tetratricopeptide (TPR) repeat protein